ncbi:hypothetical protein C8R46DRAFT_1343049 [Mycena filopes]|nr:hypothetical protein C8R46DRAFT_1343049 [Mycena filopes]
MSEPPSTKRKRVEPGFPAAADGTVTRSKIWKPFGDIILQAESTQFRVSRDILAEHSSVFRDMFAVPQPPNEPTVEGCQIVHVSDTAQDWELLFEVLYDPFKSVGPQPYAVVASTLRLGRKYEMPGPKEDALRRIHAEFPTSLAKYDSNGGNWSVIKYDPDILVKLLNLVHECGVYSAIPALGLPCLSNYSLKDLAAVLQHEIFVMLAIALEAVVKFQRKETLAWLRPGNTLIPHESCTSDQGCVEEKAEVALEVNLEAQETAFQLGYTIDEWPGDWSDRLCGVCEETAKAYHEACRRKGWDLLPTFFGLPKWEDLKDSV